mmetsp:Transcript_12494/g.17032  ORF Transcript_12494/g.17032 Transcript_12494/m.17032 type:complete len:133 (-) Transcript_12494:200-598(-)
MATCMKSASQSFSLSKSEQLLNKSSFTKMNTILKKVASKNVVVRTKAPTRAIWNPLAAFKTEFHDITDSVNVDEECEDVKEPLDPSTLDLPSPVGIGTSEVDWRKLASSTRDCQEKEVFYISHVARQLSGFH